MFKNHLDMIGRNEPIQRKAKFWQSYVRSLKVASGERPPPGQTYIQWLQQLHGTDDMRAPDPVHIRPRGIFRPLLSDLPDLHTTTWPYKSIYDDPTAANERIHVPGYRYVPVSRETYGISPRNIYPPSNYDRYRTGPSDGVYKGQDAWDAQQKRLDEIDKLFPDRYIPLFQYRPAARTLRGSSVPPLGSRARSSSPFARGRSTSPPPPVRSWTPPPQPSEVVPRLSYADQPQYGRGGWTRRPLSELLEPLPSMPKSRITRDPWWWEYPELRPYGYPYHYRPWHSPSYLRRSYLSPIKNTYLWDRHPARPYGYLTYW
ncbi:hypothetical protein ONE63_001807 [Megalurothrips usitatus]|uniref:Myofilin n=1 Tax=Megalurothrips usitatus TaxID=439358 RepID=A0AAV7XDQ5_9NEOP|nr:hypothetical protein ONE63_001807 [Megalurothrips usitatus]